MYGVELLIRVASLKGLYFLIYGYRFIYIYEICKFGNAGQK